VLPGFPIKLGMTNFSYFAEALLDGCHLEHVFGERSFTPNIAERFLNRSKNELISK